MKKTLIAAILCWAATSGLAQASVVAFKRELSDAYQGTTLTWTVAQFTATNAMGTGSATLQFGLNVPQGYIPGTDVPVPLVLYLHGAGARGSNITSVLQRQTPRHFAWQSQTVPEYQAFVIAPQVPTNGFWANTPWSDGPYEQTAATYTDSMCLTERLVDYLIDPNHNAALATALGIDARDIDTRRIYVVGDSMGAYGAWDTVARRPGHYAAAVAAAGSGPRNKLTEIRQTPFWAIHGQVDTTVPNHLPTAMDRDGAGSLGMLALIDPNFDNTVSTAIVRLDNYASRADDPNEADTLLYTELPSAFNHSTVATQWTTLVSGVQAWLFSTTVPAVAVWTVGPIQSLVASPTGMILSINGIDIRDLVLGTTTFPDPPKHTDPAYQADKADNFDLRNGASGDDQPYYETRFPVAVTTVFLIENNGNDSGYFQALDLEGQPVGPPAAFTQNVDYLKTAYRFFLNQQASGIMFVPPHPIHGIRIIKPDSGALGFDALSISGVPAPVPAP
jgi:predicted esterase